MKTKNSIRNLLKSLPTAESKNNAILELVERGKTNNRDYINRAINHCRSRHNFSRAIEIAKKRSSNRLKQLVDEGIDFYESKGKIDSAVAIARDEGNVEKTIELLLRNGRISEAAYEASNAGMYAKAIEIFERIGKYSPYNSQCKSYFEVAFHLAKKHGPEKEKRRFFRKTLDDFLEKKWIDVAIEFAKEEGDDSEVERLKHWDVTLFELEGKKLAAAERARYYGFLNRVAGYYESIGRYEEAGEIEEKEGNFEKATEMYKRAKDYCRAVELAEKHGSERQKINTLCEEGIEYYKSKSQFLAAARLAKRINNQEKLEEICNKGIADCLKKKDQDKSGNSGLEAKPYMTLATKLALELGDLDSAVNFYSEIGWGYFYENSKRIYCSDRALEIAKQIGEQNRDYSKAFEVLERFFGYTRCLELARETGDKNRIRAYEIILSKASN